MQTECSADLFGFARVEGRAVVAGFDGGRMSSSSGESGANLIFGANAIDGRRGCPASIGWDRINRLA